MKSQVILARQIIQRRRQREQMFGRHLFGEPCWDMLLDLYVAQADHQAISVSSLCIAAAVPSTTALRWIDHMVREGLIERYRVPHDRRRVFLRLSKFSIQRLETLLSAEGLDTQKSPPVFGRANLHIVS